MITSDLPFENSSNIPLCEAVLTQVTTSLLFTSQDSVTFCYKGKKESTQVKRSILDVILKFANNIPL